MEHIQHIPHRLAAVKIKIRHKLHPLPVKGLDQPPESRFASIGLLHGKPACQGRKAPVIDLFFLFSRGKASLRPSRRLDTLRRRKACQIPGRFVPAEASRRQRSRLSFRLQLLKFIYREQLHCGDPQFLQIGDLFHHALKGASLPGLEAGGTVHGKAPHMEPVDQAVLIGYLRRSFPGGHQFPGGCCFLGGFRCFRGCPCLTGLRLLALRLPVPFPCLHKGRPQDALRPFSPDLPAAEDAAIGI